MGIHWTVTGALLVALLVIGGLGYLWYIFSERKGKRK